MFTKYQDKNDLIAGLFLDYGKNVSANKDVIANYVANLSHIDYNELEKIIDRVNNI